MTQRRYTKFVGAPGAAVPIFPLRDAYDSVSRQSFLGIGRTHLIGSKRSPAESTTRGSSVQSSPDSVQTASLTDAWLAESVRVSVFYTGDTKPKPYLEQVIGSPAEQVAERPAEGLRQEVAPFGVGQVVITQAPGRVDLIYAAKPSTGAAANPLVNVDGLKAAIELARSLGAKLSSKIAGVTRVAFCPIAVKQTASDIETIQLLHKYLPMLPLDPSTDSEIFWQMNRRKKAQSFDGYINNISKWQSMTTQVVSMMIPSSTRSAALEAVSIFFARLELDINTAEDLQRGPFGAKLSDVYDETCRHAFDLLSRGQA